MLDEAFWPEGAWATWHGKDVFDTHHYEITDEVHDLANHSLFFWTAVATVASDLASMIQDFASILASELGFGCDLA